jgi:hypothetical protein
VVSLLYQKGRDSRIFQAQDRAIDDFDPKLVGGSDAVDPSSFKFRHRQAARVNGCMSYGGGNRGKSRLVAQRGGEQATCAASRDLLEVSELDLERDCAAADTGVLAVPPHLVHDLSKRIARPIRARRMQVRTPPLYRLAGVAV